MENRKCTILLTVIAVATLLVAVVAATFAYFQAQGGGSANTSIVVTSNTTDNLSFEVGIPININVTQDNFGQDMGNQAGSTTASATLTANNATNQATRNYYLYLDITNNEFTYTIDENTPELILTIIDPTGAPVTDISGLKYVTVGEVSGFDITTASDIITLASNYEITSTGTQTQTWNITVTFVNLDTDQVGNAGKNFEASLIIQEELLQMTVNLASHIIDTLYIADGENGLYYHDGVGSYTNADQEAGDNSYRYAGANPNNYICFGSDGETCPNDNLYRIIGVFDGQVKLIKNDYATNDLFGMTGDYYGTYENAGYGDSYYKGQEPISSIGVYYWNNANAGSSINDWVTSRLNTVNLNTNYINNIGSDWANLITDATWNVGGMTYSQTNTVKQAYAEEVGNNTVTENFQVGLMYVSDYGYAASPENWSLPLYNLDNDTNRNNNWMYMGLTEWTLTKRSEDTIYVFRISDSGNVDVNGVSIFRAARPVFYLDSSVEIDMKNLGTQTDPYRIVL